MAKSQHVQPSSEHQCCGVLQEAAEVSMKRREERRNKPQPWIARKITILFVIGIIAYDFYVYIGRFCVPMLRDDTGILGGRRIAIPFLVVFCLLGVMISWTYAVVIFTGPGIAKDHVSASPEPDFGNYIAPFPPSSEDLSRGPYAPEPHHNTEEGNGHVHPQHGDDNSTNPTVTDFSEKPIEPQDPNIGVTDTIRPRPSLNSRAVTPNLHANGAGNGIKHSSNQQPMMFTRKPPAHPALLPEYRYCYKDGFVKPMRAHHCRACGTCVLKYDHHCPWIGQCVGARNQKFFVNFLQWALLFCAWTFSTLVAQNVKSSRGDNGSIDVQEVVIIAFAGLFTLFTGALLATQIRLIVMNCTTVETFSHTQMREREKAKLARLYSWYQFAAKRQLRKEWDQEWGRIDKEGHLWWLGSSRRNWEYVMGRSVWEWILPIGKSEGDGLTFPVNPRFQPDGKWRPRREWPKELQ